MAIKHPSFFLNFSLSQKKKKSRRVLTYIFSESGLKAIRPKPHPLFVYFFFFFFFYLLLTISIFQDFDHVVHLKMPIVFTQVQRHLDYTL